MTQAGASSDGLAASSDALLPAPSFDALPVSLSVDAASAPSAETSLASSSDVDDELLEPEPPPPALDDVPVPELPELELEWEPPLEEFPYAVPLAGVPASLPQAPTAATAADAKSILNGVTLKRPRRLME